MDSLRIFVGMIYGEWFILLLFLFLAISPLIYLRSKIQTPKVFFSWLFGGLLTFLVFFYFIIPVPDTVQQREIGFIKNFQTENESPALFNLERVMENECGSSYLKAYQYFLMINAFRADFDITLNSKKVVSMGSVNSDKNHSETKLCNLKNRLNKFE